MILLKKTKMFYHFFKNFQDIFIEKPLCLSLEQTEILYQIAHQNNECKPKIHRMHNQYENYFKQFQFDPNNEILTRQIQKAVFL